MPQNWINMVNTQEYIIPLRQLKLKIGSKNLYNCTNYMQYSCFIQSKKLLPIGFEKWCLEYNFNDVELKNIFLMGKTASVNVFNQCFQYKILTQILPTQEYLLRYKVDGVVDNVCKMCKLERCTIEHSIFECIFLQPFLVLIQKFIEGELKYKITFCRKTFLFGVLSKLHKYSELKSKSFSC